MGDLALHMPAEWEPHLGTLMTWPTAASLTDDEWSSPGVNVQDTYAELATLAEAISAFEPVHVFVKDPKARDLSHGKKDSGYSAAQNLLSRLRNVTIHTTPHVDSLWARDTGPVFVRSCEPIENSWDKDDDPGPGFNTRDAKSTTVGVLLGFHIVNGGVVMPKFGDRKADEEARRIVQDCFPSRRVVQVQLQQLALQGGGIHCSTKQIIR